MKKTCMIFVAMLTMFALISCSDITTVMTTNGLTTVSTTIASTEATTDATTVVSATTEAITTEVTTIETTTSFINPFPGMDFIRRINISNDVVNKITNSSGRIAYIDEEIYVYYEEGLNAASFFVDVSGVTHEFDTHAPMSFSDNFIMNYDAEHQVMYYYANSRIHALPNDIDDEINLYASDIRDFKYTNSQYSLIANEFISFRGDHLFTVGETTVFPYQNIGDELRFYSYNSGTSQDHGCTIQSYDGFDDPISSTVVHDDYVCSSDYKIVNRHVIIEFIDFTTTAGYAIICPDGEIYIMDFATMMPDFKSYDYDTYGVAGGAMMYFRYTDNSNESHHVATNFDLSYIGIDEMDSSMASKTKYAVGEYRFYQYSSTEYRIYKDDVKFYTYATRNSSGASVLYNMINGYGVIYETGMSGNGRLTRVDLNDGTTDVYDIWLLSVSGMVSHYLICSDESGSFLYDIENDSRITLEADGAIKIVNDDYFLIYTDDLVYIYDVNDLSLTETNKVGFLRRTLIPYAFLVEYEGNYFIIG